MNNIPHTMFLAQNKTLSALCYALWLCIPACSNTSFDWESIQVRDTLVLHVQNRAVGELLHTIRVDSQNSCVIVEKRVDVGAGAQGSAGAMKLRETWQYNYDGSARKAQQSLQSPSGTTCWELKKQKDVWKLDVTNAGTTKSREIKNAIYNLRTTYTLFRAIKNGSVSKGQTWIDTAFDMMSAQQIVIKTTCIEAPSGNAKHGVFINKDNVINREERWEVDGNGKTIIMEVAPIFTARRKTGETTPSIAGIAEIADGFIVPAPRGPVSGETIVLTIKDGATLHESVKNLYIKTGGGYAVKPMQAHCKTQKQITGGGNTEWLKATVTVQADAKPIRALAKKLAAGTNDWCEIARTFNRYVFKHVEKRNVATFSNALETLNAGYGDCGEHAVLLAALLRGAGVPSRVVYGMVYIGQKKGFLYHAWVQVKAAGWINADPALGKFPARSNYVPLIIDDSGENSIFLANIIGRIEIKYVQSESLGLKK